MALIDIEQDQLIASDKWKELYTYYAPKHFTVSYEIWWDGKETRHSIRVMPEAHHGNCGKSILFTSGKNFTEAVNKAWIEWKQK
jgi:hypothetical protein